MKHFFYKTKHFFNNNFIWLGLSSLIWLLLRSGTKPSRLQYPCQRAAMSTGSVFLSVYTLPGLVYGLKGLGLRLPNLKFSHRTAIGFGILAIAVIIMTISFRTRPPRPINSLPAVAIHLPTWNSKLPNPSHLFVIDSFPIPDTTVVYHEG